MNILPSKLLHNVHLVLPHALLLSTTVLYCIFGAIVFHCLELPFEVDHLQMHSRNIQKAQDRLENLHQDLNTSQLAVDAAIEHLIYVTFLAFDEGIRSQELRPIFEENATSKSLHPKWNFHSSLFFTSTLVTSIGYGNIVPISPLGRIFCIAYAFLGIPLTLITIADLAKFLSDIIMQIGSKLESRRRGRVCAPSGGTFRSSFESFVGSKAFMENSDPYTKAFVISILFSYIATTAFIFSKVQEGWNFLDSFYFCVCSIVTIGFGDFSPEEEGHYGGWIAFIFIGLILSTLTIDVVGYSYIKQVHNLGRGLDFASIFEVLKIGREEDGTVAIDSARQFRQLYFGAYIPTDLRLIPYIDHFLANSGRHGRRVTILGL